MSPFRLSWLELRRFRGHPVRVAALAAIILLPLVCGGLYLWFAWDPYGELDHMPVAVVNEDQGAIIESEGETTEVNGGDQLVEQLEGDRIFDWRFTDAAEARRGLENGDHYMVITVPEDFSERLASLAGDDPRQAAVEFELNDANGHLAGIMASTAERELQNQINTAVYVTFAKTMFGDLDELNQGLSEAAGGASELADGIGGAETGAEALESDLSELTGAAQAASDGADEVSTSVDRVVGAAVPLLDGMAENWDDIQAGSQAGADLTDRAATALDQAHGALCEDGAGDRAACDALKEHIDEAVAANGDVQSANGTVQTIPTSTVGSAADSLGDLRTSASDVAAGADDLAVGAESARSEAADLAGGLTELQEDADSLASNLEGTIDRIPSENPAEDADNAEAYGSPVSIEEENLNPAGTNGRGQTPFIIAITLWVFGLIAYLLLRPANPLALAGPLRSTFVAVGGWMPGAVLGVVAAVVLYAVLDIRLGLDPEHGAATVGVCALVVLAFSAMAHLLRLAAGAAGSLLIVVLLMLQVTSAGGLFPVETTPAFFQALHPWLPMTYVVDALRVTVSGGRSEDLVRAMAVLGVYLLASLTLASLVVALRRKWSADRLNPPLRL